MELNGERHVTPDELEGLRAGTLAPERLLDVSDHVRACARCAALAQETAVAGRLATAWRDELRADTGADEHVAPELLAALVDGMLGEADREAVVSHVAICPICAEDADDLRAAASEIIPDGRDARRLPRKAIWASVAGVAAALLLFVIWRNPPAADTPPPATSIADIPSAVYLVDGSRTLRLEGDEVHGAALDGDEKRVMLAALRDGRIDLPASAAQIAAKAGTLLGPASAAEFAVVKPIATAVAAARPTFEWRPRAGARGYTVEVFDDGFAPVARSARVTGTSWTIDRDLLRGARYIWQVTAETPDGAVRAPVPPAAEARFFVLGAGESAAFDDLARRHAGSPLTLGILEANLGLLDLAEGHLAEAARANPNSPVVAALRDRVIRARAGS